MADEEVALGAVARDVVEALRARLDEVEADGARRGAPDRAG